MPETDISWQDFLFSQGASLTPQTVSEIDRFSAIVPEPAGDFFSPQLHLGVLAAQGPDAANFLHNQLTNDVLSLDDTTARLAGYCSPKGRLLATMLIWKSGEQFLMALPREILPAIQKRLQMFVMRSKLTLTDVSDSMALIGIMAPPEKLTGLSPSSLPATSYAVTQDTAGTLIRLPDAGQKWRYQWVGELTQARAVWPMLARQLPPVANRLWRWSEIVAGLPQITLATQEQFVPQMVNFELIGGVNFRKGCYPGQEIVARSQYLGKFKRRMLIAQVDAGPIKAGMDVFSAADPAQPCGMIVNAEPGPDGVLTCLVEIKLDAAEQPVHLGVADGPLLHFLTLPYPLPAPA